MKLYSWFFAVIGICVVARTPVMADPPNIVVFLADDLGYGEAGCYGGQQIPTPHLDRLARSGIRFTQAYVTASYCAASRAGLLTGRYQTRFGFENNPIGALNEDPRIGLPRSEVTLADRLRELGYVTGLVGKWHLGGTAQYHPQRRGFDEFFGFLHEGHYFVPPPWQHVTTWLRRTTLPDGSHGRWTSPNGRVVWSTHMSQHEPAYDANNPILRNSQPINESEYLTKAFGREASRFIERHDSQPFFLLVAYNAVHSPMQATEQSMQRFAHIEDIQRRIFASMLGSLDDSLGQVMQTLDDRQLTRNTLIVFLSDNGGPTKELTSSNRPYRGEKGSLYEGGVRVPFVASWPQRLGAGRVEDRIVSTLDLTPTLLAAAGQALPSPLDGVNLLPYLSEEKQGSPHDTLYWRMNRRAALRYENWKIVRAASGPSSAWELYDLSQDPAEAHDLSDQRPHQLSEMVERWSHLDQQMVPALW